MKYRPGATPQGASAVPAYLGRELAKIAAAYDDDSPRVAYLTNPLVCAITANNMAPTGMASANVLLISASVALQTITGLARIADWRQMWIVQRGAGVVLLQNEDAASSASNRFALVSPWTLSTNAVVCLWYDAISSRWRGLHRL